MVGLMHNCCYIQYTLYTLVQEEDWPCSFHTEDPHGATVFLSLLGLYVGSNTAIGGRICIGRLCHQTGTDGLAYASLALWTPSQETMQDKPKKKDKKSQYKDKSQLLVRTEEDFVCCMHIANAINEHRYRGCLSGREQQIKNIMYITFCILQGHVKNWSH